MDLWSECRNVLITIWPRDSESSQQIQHTMESWIAIDADGEAFRYPVTNSRNSRPRMPTLPAALRHIDLQAMYEDVSAILDLRGQRRMAPVAEWNGHRQLTSWRTGRVSGYSADIAPRL